MSSILKNLFVHMHARRAAILVIVPVKRDYTSQRCLTTRALNVSNNPTLEL